MTPKPGYKMTEVGEIPVEWEVETIAQLIEEQSILGHLDGNHGALYPRSHEFKTHGVPYVGANDFDCGKVSFERCKFLSEEKAAIFRKGIARDGDVLFAHNATVGPTALLRTYYDFVILSTSATYFRCNPARLSNSYLRNALESQHFVRQCQSLMAQSTRNQVPITTQRKMTLIVPPLPEQRAIAEALSDVDALLASLDTLIAKKRDLKQAAMQQLLTGKTRLPGFEGKWVQSSLSENAIKVGSGITPTGGSRVYKTSGRPFLRSQNIGWGVLLLEDIAFIDDQTHESFPATEVEAGDVLLNITGASIGRCAIADMRVRGGNVNQHVCIIRPHPILLDSAFLSYQLLSSDGQQKIESFQSSGNRQGLNFAQIRSFCFPLPPLPEQRAIAEVLSDMDAEIAALEQRRDKTRALKQGMMQELLTGRTRLLSPDSATRTEVKP